MSFAKVVVSKQVVELNMHAIVELARVFGQQLQLAEQRWHVLGQEPKKNEEKISWKC